MSNIPVHLCHAIGCGVPVPPKLFMCKRHWYMLPRFLRLRIWEFYVPGQEDRKDPSAEYLEAAEAARLDVVRREYGIEAKTTADARRILDQRKGVRP